MIISAFDMFSIGIGPSSSHTVGPMRAAKKFTDDLAEKGLLDSVASVKVELFGSLGQTGIGHGTGKAVILGLAGYLPETVDPDAVPGLLKQVEDEQQIRLAKLHPVSFPREGAIVFHRRKTLK
ncbi:MAG TPA: serine dehydratase beta chain, partial [Rheinheimera sp.]|nr:serine dehydratase beta chain [Rheinheimera sp.]